MSKNGRVVEKMNAGFMGRLANRLANWPHLLLAVHLLMLHALAFGGWQAAQKRFFADGALFDSIFVKAKKK